MKPRTKKTRIQFVYINEIHCLFCSTSVVNKFRDLCTEWKVKVSPHTDLRSKHPLRNHPNNTMTKSKYCLSTYALQRNISLFMRNSWNKERKIHNTADTPAECLRTVTRLCYHGYIHSFKSIIYEVSLLHSLQTTIYSTIYPNKTKLKRKMKRKKQKTSSAIKLKFIRDIESHWERFQHYLYVVNVCKYYETEEIQKKWTEKTIKKENQRRKKCSKTKTLIKSMMWGKERGSEKSLLPDSRTHQHSFHIWNCVKRTKNIFINKTSISQNVKFL